MRTLALLFVSFGALFAETAAARQTPYLIEQRPVIVDHLSIAPPADIKVLGRSPCQGRWEFPLGAPVAFCERASAADGKLNCLNLERARPMGARPLRDELAQAWQAAIKGDTVLDSSDDLMKVAGHDALVRRGHVRGASGEHDAVVVVVIGFSDEVQRARVVTSAGDQRAAARLLALLSDARDRASRRVGCTGARPLAAATTSTPPTPTAKPPADDVPGATEIHILKLDSTATARQALPFLCAAFLTRHGSAWLVDGDEQSIAVEDVFRHEEGFDVTVTLQRFAALVAGPADADGAGDRFCRGKPGSLYGRGNHDDPAPAVGRGRLLTEVDVARFDAACARLSPRGALAVVGRYVMVSDNIVVADEVDALMSKAPVSNQPGSR